MALNSFGEVAVSLSLSGYGLGGSPSVKVACGGL